MPRPDDEASGLGTTRLDEPTLSGEPKKEFDVFGCFGDVVSIIVDDVVDDDDDDDDDEYHYFFLASEWRIDELQLGLHVFWTT